MIFRATIVPPSAEFDLRAAATPHLAGGSDLHLAGLLAVSAVGSLVVFALAVGAFRRRRSLPYLLITAALGALVMRPVVGAGTLLGVVPMWHHHFLEHLLDVVIAALLLAAVFSVRALDTAPDAGAQTPENADSRGTENE